MGFGVFLQGLKLKLNGCSLVRVILDEVPSTCASTKKVLQICTSCFRFGGQVEKLIFH